jgi:hypothetical protein
VRACAQRRILATTVLVFALGCAGRLEATRPGRWLERLSAAPRPPAGRHWPVPPAEMEKLLRTGKGEVRERHEVGSGVTGAERFTTYFPALRRNVDFKWKAAPSGDADGWNNNPRKELAAYEIQKWFLPPGAYVVPTTVARCVPLDSYRRLEPKAEPTLPGTRCVFGVEAMWLQNVEVPEDLYEEARFRRDPVYARHLANFNLLTYLIDDRDTRKGNVLTSTDASNRRVFSVDNGISFDPLLYNPFENQWKDIRVPALPRESVERLRAVTPSKARELSVVAQFRTDREGILRPVRPGPALDPERGSRFRDGVLQLGLTDGEIEHVWERVQELLREVDERKIPLF